MKYFFLLIYILSSPFLFSQQPVSQNAGTLYQGVSKPSKPIIDSAAVNNWPRLGNEPSISNDGNYTSYIVYNKPKDGYTLTIQSTQNKWKKEMVNATPIGFSGDSKTFVCQIGDTISFISLGINEAQKYVSDIKSWKQPKFNDMGWMGWQLSHNPTELILENFNRQTRRVYKDVKEYSFDEQGKKLLLYTVSNSLIWVDLELEISKTIWSATDMGKTGGSANNFTFDRQGSQLAFVVRYISSQQSESNEIWYYNLRMDKAVMKVCNQSAGVDSFLTLTNSIRFSNDGKHIYTFLKKVPDPKPNLIAGKLDVWNYKDTILQSSQKNQGMMIDPGEYQAVIAVNNDKVIRLCVDIGDFIKVPVLEGEYFIVGNNTQGDRFWLNQQDINWLVSLNDGTRKILPFKGGNRFLFSSDGRKLIYYDNDSHNYFSYDIQMSTKINLTASLPRMFMEETDRYDHADKVHNAVGIAGWLDSGKKVLVYDDYDIWALDVDGKSNPENITNGYGRKHHIKFRLMAMELGKKQDWVITAFNIDNKENGFYRIDRERHGNPQLLVMGPYTFYHSNISTLGGPELSQALIPLKARYANKWIVKRESSTQSPNLFLTEDFQTFQPLTDLEPEASYNWIRSELVNWKQPDGYNTQAILYKPENFDPRKKYPVLFVIYMQLSQRLNEFPLPDYSGGPINIPWFVSQGYLVFTPDIHFTKGRRGANALTTCLSGAQVLAKLSYIDTSKMAVVGHSFSGLMVNYIVANSHFFAAALAGSGTSDEISSSLQLSGYGLKKTISRLSNAETRMGASLWQRPSLYIAESPVLKAQMVTTPLLLFHSMTDGLPWEQSIEMFISLRRNSKKTWLLQYDDAGHVAFGKDAEDFTIRVNQFFDHYLKDKPAPRWMTSGIRASHRGIDYGYELDYNGKCGTDCKVCNSFSRRKNK
ncbi:MULTISPECIES: alpha/beta hydrolase family protein [Niastella]|uniref:S9 family peptidase n=1 Tax=Niastella soli TaxID=2821487 RepID=A0ABS3Z1K5_9BACT|nr:prolyl oligopeptidase family serine peptidase [Niastella soli]MBO9203276.1 S9 family peptidase [Niastella soli]